MSAHETITRIVQGMTLRATASVEYQDQLQTVVGVFEPLVAEWRDGYMVMFGWGPLFLRGDADKFTIVAPDYMGEPGDSMTEDLTVTLFVTLAMTSTAVKVGVPPIGTEADDGIICVRGWETARSLKFSRLPPTPGDSGWFIEPFDLARTEPWDEADLVGLSAWQVMQQRVSAVRPLALPLGYVAIMGGDLIRAILRESDGALVVDQPF